MKSPGTGLEDTHYVTPFGAGRRRALLLGLRPGHLGGLRAGKPGLPGDLLQGESAKVEFGNPPHGRWLKNHNKLLNLFTPMPSG